MIGALIDALSCGIARQLEQETGGAAEQLGHSALAALHLVASGRNDDECHHLSVVEQVTGLLVCTLVIFAVSLARFRKQLA